MARICSNVRGCFVSSSRPTRFSSRSSGSIRSSPAIVRHHTRHALTSWLSLRRAISAGCGSRERRPCDRPPSGSSWHHGPAMSRDSQSDADAAIVVTVHAEILLDAVSEGVERAGQGARATVVCCPDVKDAVAVAGADARRAEVAAVPVLGARRGRRRRPRLDAATLRSVRPTLRCASHVAVPSFRMMRRAGPVGPDPRGRRSRSATNSSRWTARPASRRRRPRPPRRWAACRGRCRHAGGADGGCEPALAPAGLGRRRPPAGHMCEDARDSADGPPNDALPRSGPMPRRTTSRTNARILAWLGRRCRRWPWASRSRSSPDRSTREAPGPTSSWASAICLLGLLLAITACGACARSIARCAGADTRP